MQRHATLGPHFIPAQARHAAARRLARTLADAMQRRRVHAASATLRLFGIESSAFFRSASAPRFQDISGLASARAVRPLASDEPPVMVERRSFGVPRPLARQRSATRLWHSERKQRVLKRHVGATVAVGEAVNSQSLRSSVIAFIGPAPRRSARLRFGAGTGLRARAGRLGSLRLQEHAGARLLGEARWRGPLATANPSLNRTRNGRPRLGLISFGPKRGLPLRAV